MPFYTAGNWEDWPSTETLITAARLEALENALAAASHESGTYASRPSPGVAGRLYYVTAGRESQGLEIDTGSTWEPLAGVGSNRILYCSGVYGNDSYAGTSWQRAYQTLQAAHDAANSGDVIYLGHFDGPDSVSITKDNLAFIGTSHGRTLGGSARIKAPAVNSTIFAVNAANVTLKNLLIDPTNQTLFTGYGIDANNGSGLYCENINYHFVDDATKNQNYGGTGIRLRNSEEFELHNIQISNSTLALSLGVEASTGVFSNLWGANNWQDIVSTSDGGGRLFLRSKFTQGGDPAQVRDVISMTSGDDVFVSCDWDEGATNNVRLAGPRCTFIRPVSAPQSKWIIEGDDCTVIMPRILGQEFVLDGDDITVMGGTSTVALRGAGDRNRIINFEATEVNVSGADWVYDPVTRLGTQTALGTTPSYLRPTRQGTGSPESVVTGVIGDMFVRTDGAAATTLYVKTSGTGNTGWQAIG